MARAGRGFPSRRNIWRPAPRIFTSSLDGVSGSLSGNTIKMTTKSIIGTITGLSGNLSKKFYLSITGVISALSAEVDTALVWAYNISGIAGDITGDVTKNTIKSLIGIIEQSGTLVKETSKIFIGSITSLTGVLVVSFLKSVFGSIGNISATITKLFSKSLTGNINTLTGSIAKKLNRILTGAVGSISANIIRLRIKNISGVISNISGAAGRFFSKPLTGAITISGIITKRISRSLTGIVGSASGSVIYKAVLHRARLGAGTVVRKLIGGGSRD